MLGIIRGVSVNDKVALAVKGGCRDRRLSMQKNDGFEVFHLKVFIENIEDIANKATF